MEESGSELVEFALSSSLLLLVIFGIMDCSRALYTYHYVAQAARLGTRYAAVRGVSATGLLCGTSPFQCVATASDVSNYVKSISPLGLSASNLSVATDVAGNDADGHDVQPTFHQQQSGMHGECEGELYVQLHLAIFAEIGVADDQHLQDGDCAVEIVPFLVTDSRGDTLRRRC